MGKYIRKDDACALFDMKLALDKEVREIEKLNPEGKKCVDPNEEVMQRVKALLNPKLAEKFKQEPYVPEQLEEVMEDLKRYVEETGVILYEIKNIQYGKKLRFKVGYKLSEINLFYGKHGFSVMQSPRSGTSADLNELMAQLINSFIYTL